MNISGILIHASPGKVAAVKAAVSAFPGVEVVIQEDTTARLVALLALRQRQSPGLAKFFQEQTEEDGRLQAISFRGRFQIVSIAIPDTEIVFKFEMETAVSLPAVGGEIRIAINPEHIQLLTQS